MKMVPGSVMIMLLAVACTTLRQPVSVEILKTGEVRDFPRALVVTRDSVQRELTDVHVAGDSLSGVLDPSTPRVSIALAQVARVEVLERVPAPAVVGVGHFLLDTVVEFGRMIGTVVRSLFLKC